MFTETAACIVFILIVCLTPAPTLASAALALLIHTIHTTHEQSALILKLRKKLAKDEATITGLRDNSSRLEVELLSTSAWNRSLTEQNEEYKNSTFSMQESIHTLSEDLSQARETVDQHEATIFHLKEAQAKHETTIAELQRQLPTLEADLLATSSRNCALEKENEGYKTSTLSMQDFIHTLSEDLSKAREREAEDDATITHLKDTQANHETTSAELRQQVSTFEAQNRVLTEDNEKNKTISLSLKESIHTLSKDLSNAREKVAQHDATITNFEQRNLELEGKVAERNQRVFALSQTCEEAASSVVVLRVELEQKTKEAADWKDLFVHSDLNTSRPDQAKYRRWASEPGAVEPSLTGIITAKDQEIAQLKDRISEKIVVVTRA
ncbi:hypothetical protein EST38_g2853 [Candolleomyces aberdarensis]|uniref:Uncharacterized protein n=1 Tax=Candolleomyces aberdarensis TaxID=2316362 RepID=A0A4Q2DSH9_9AGAR|nr:hypothetical protein EST38_g2853 [Candolleomyces aberdarensis]